MDGENGEVREREEEGRNGGRKEKGEGREGGGFTCTLVYHGRCGVPGTLVLVGTPS